MTVHRPRRRALPALIALLALLLVAAAPAPAASRHKIIMDCADDGRLQGSYTREELRDARKNLPSDIAEYTDCADVLRRAELPDSGGGPGGTTTGGGTPGAPGSLDPGEPLTPVDDAERAVLADAGEDGGAAVEVGGERVVPGASGLAPGTKTNGLPAPLLATLILLGAAAVAALAPALRRTGLRRLLRLGRP